MHEPMGFSGVHTVPKTLQSRGCFTPRRMAPHSQALLSATEAVCRSKRRSASKVAKASRMRSAL
jgi:hypothetical protein